MRKDYKIEANKIDMSMIAFATLVFIGVNLLKDSQTYSWIIFYAFCVLLFVLIIFRQIYRLSCFAEKDY